MEHIMLCADSYLDEENDINVHRYTVKDDARIHTHDFNEIAYISDGKGTHRIGTDTYKVKKGDLVILNAYVPHQFVSEDDAPLVIYNCVFQPPAIDRDLKENSSFVHVAYRYLFHSFYDKDMPRDFIKLSDVQSAAIEPVLREMLREREKKKNGYHQVLKSDLMRLLIFIFRLYKEDTLQTHDIWTYKKLVVKNSLAFMRDHCDKEIRIEDLAGRAYVSSGYFSRIFKEITGDSVIKALQKLRMEKAGEILEKTNYSVSDVAASVGYTDLKYFYSLFSQHYDMTPGKYRNRKRHNL